MASTVIFDCDGVILQSNKIKSDAFGKVLKAHDPALVAEFVAWHKRTGGVSRFEKFAVFFRDTLKVSDWQEKTDEACLVFGDLVSRELCRCPYIPGFEALLGTLQEQGIPLAVNTGGAESEIREVFRHRGVFESFEVILGSPATKHDNMLMLKKDGLVQSDGVFVGDSRLDFDLAQEFGMRFVYVAHESEWDEGAAVTRGYGGQVVADLRDWIGSA